MKQAYFQGISGDRLVWIGFGGDQTGDTFAGQPPHQTLAHAARDQNLHLAQRMGFVRRAKDLLYRLGEGGRALFTLRCGVIKLVQYLPDGSQRIVRLLKDGDVLGLEALIGQPYQHEAIALTDCEICAIPVEVIERPGLRRELMARWQQALTEADVWLTQFGTGTARQRVARLLLRLTCVDQDRLPLFCRQDIGAMLGLTTETVSRTIAELRRQGLLRDHGAHIQDCDRETLRRIADGEE